jgi:Uma2 family endonuclease
MNAGAFTPLRLFTVAEYHRMAEAGIFTEDDRVELIEGEVVAKSPIGPRHAACVKKLAALVRGRTAGRGLVIGVQDPIGLSEHSEPLPDLSILHPRDDFYAGGHPRPSDVFVVLEVADASVMYDRNTKLPLYARAGIREVWLVDLVRNGVDVYSSPSATGYATQQRFGRGATAVSLAVPELVIPVDEILVDGLACGGSASAFRVERRRVARSTYPSYPSYPSYHRPFSDQIHHPCPLTTAGWKPIYPE